MLAALSSDPALSPDDLVDLARSAPSMVGRDLVREVTCREPYSLPCSAGEPESPALFRGGWGGGLHVVAYDFGVKHSILRWLAEFGCRVTVVPATTPAAEALALDPDGVFLSNGPGDPAAVTYAIQATRDLIESGVPTFGICLGHQIIGLALGGQTYKLKFGHRGGNQPVRDAATGRVQISAHNHGFAVVAGSLPGDVAVTHVNLNDGCVEGLRHTTRPVFSVQYHPEASPGPHDALPLFAEFVEVMKKEVRSKE